MFGVSVIVHDGLTMEEYEDILLSNAKYQFYNKVYKDEIYLILANTDDVSEDTFTDGDIQRIITVHVEDLYDRYGEAPLILNNGRKITIYA